MGVYRGITQDNVTVQGGTLYDVTISGATLAGTLTGNVDATAGYIQLRTAAATAIADKDDAINTSGKAAGTIVFDTTNSKIKVAVERQLVIIGEALNKLRLIESEIVIENDKQIIGFRNRLVHAYDSIDNSIVWAILNRHLEKLKTEIEILQNL